MSGPIEESRDDLVAALTTGGRAPIPQPGGVWTAPAWLLEGGSPWASAGVSKAGAALLNWRVHVVVGRVDSPGAWDLLVTECDTVVAILAALPGWTYPVVGAPRILGAKGTDYLSAEISVATHYTGG